MFFIWILAQSDPELVHNMFKNYFRSSTNGLGGLGGIPQLLFVLQENHISGFSGYAQFEEIAFVLIFGIFSNILMPSAEKSINN